MQAGQRGFLVTCFRGREGAATKEAYHILEPLLSNRDGNERECKEEDAEGGGTDGYVDIEQAVKAEVSALTDRKRRPLVAVKIPQVSCVLFMHIPSSKKVDGLVSDLMDRNYRLLRQTRHCQRILPIDVVCQAHAKDIVAAVSKLLAPASYEGLSYAVAIERRMSSVLAEQSDKDQLIRQLATDVFRPHGLAKVDLKRPDLLLMLQVVKGVCGISLLRQYYQRRKYNLCQKQDDVKEDSDHRS